MTDRRVKEGQTVKLTEEEKEAVENGETVSIGVEKNRPGKHKVSFEKSESDN